MTEIEIRQTDEYHTWFSRLRDEWARTRINLRIYRLSLGNAGDVRPIGGGLSELRIDYGPSYRVYLMQHGEVFVLLLCGGDKASQGRDIRQAKELAAAWREG